jgi:C1A family cysteine protease
MKNFRKISVYFLIMLFVFSCVQEGENGEDPFNPVYDLGLIAATEADLQDASNNFLPTPFQTGILPNSAILNMPPVGNQGGEGSCVAFSVGFATMSYYINKSQNGNYSYAHLGSPEFLYNLCKFEGSCSTAGSMYPKAFQVLKTKGIDTWLSMPYTDYECSQQPNSQQYANAANFKISSWGYTSINNTELIKRLLYSGHPVMVAINTYQSVYNYNGGVYSSNYGQNYGGHAVCIVGYNDSIGAYKIQNSWGNGWGENGCFWIQYGFLPQLAMENRCYYVVPNF